MKWQAEIAHQILEGLEELSGLNAPILAVNPRYFALAHGELPAKYAGQPLTDGDSWAGEIDYDAYVAHCTWLAEEGLVEPYIAGTAILLRNNPTGNIPPYGYDFGYTQPQRLTARGHRYLQAVRSQGGVKSVLANAATKVGLRAVDTGFTQILEYLGV